MSKTDKTNPWFVKLHYDHSYIEEKHDHRFGPCDLPPRPTEKDEIHWQSEGCFWYISFAFYDTPWARCGCPMCGYDAYASVPRRKRQRIDAKRYCRDGWRDEY